MLGARVQIDTAGRVGGPAGRHGYRAAMSRSGAVAVLRVTDAEASLEWYRRLGFAEEFRYRHEPGHPWYLGVVRPDGARLHLSEHLGDARPDTLVYLYVADVDALAAACGVDHVHDNPWARDFEVRDPDGNRLRVGTVPN